MSNPIKYSTGSESLALKTGNFYIGTGDVGKGPTSTTGYYNGITPPSGGYTIYLNKATGGPSIYTCANDTELISLTNSIAGTSYTTANECFIYFAGQTDKMVLNRDYEGIVTDGLVLNLDAGFTPSYPKNDTSIYDLSLNMKNGTLINGPTFSTDGGGSIVFDGSNDYIITPDVNVITNNSDDKFSICVWIKTSTTSNYNRVVQFQNNVGMYLCSDGGFGVQSNGRNSGVCASGTFIRDGDWHYVVVTYEESTRYTGYKDGSRVFTVSTPDGESKTSSDTYIGRYPSDGSYFNGSLGIVKVYNKILSDSEVLQNFNAQKGRFGL